ncbi:7475_t:CDS:10 [Paraglomus occultum]|uniref:DNA-directed RNA polymerase n=1 Tax=Paraglomus occultum TaxID=144539 RepID=A0A9N8VY20_9GLOM|nr:7475_t:CDS:10 [Paraglomus occultum]
MFTFPLPRTTKSRCPSHSIHRTTNNNLRLYLIFTRKSPYPLSSHRNPYHFHIPFHLPYRSLCFFHVPLRHQSTATHSNLLDNPPDLPSFPSSNEFKPLILPQTRLGMKGPGTMQQSVFSEQLAIMYACLKTRHIGRAEKILERLEKNSTPEMRKALDIRVYNAFLEAFLEEPGTPNYRKVMNFFQYLNDANIKPDLSTYGLITKIFLREEEGRKFVAVLTGVLEQMQMSGIPITLMVEHLNFTQKERQNLIQMLKGEGNILSAAQQEELLESIRNISVDEEEDVEQPMEAGSAPIAIDAIGVRLMKEQLVAVSERDLTDFERQMKLEENAYQAAIERWQVKTDEMLKRGIGFKIKKLTELKEILWDWHTKLVPLIAEELERVEIMKDDPERKQYGPFLRLLKAEKLSSVTILELMRLQTISGYTNGMKTAATVISVGKAVENEYNAEQIKKKNNRKMIERDLTIQALYSSGKLFHMAVRRAIEKYQNEQLPTDWKPSWPVAVKAKVGSILVSLLISCAKVPAKITNRAAKETIQDELPAFYHTYECIKGKRIGIIKFADSLIELLTKDRVRDAIHPRMLPMLVPPRPWLSHKSGGYYKTKNLAMRIRDSPEQRQYLREASKAGHLTKVFAGLDVLGSTRWAINKNVYNVVLEVWNSKQSIGGIPSAEQDLELPPKPDDYDVNAKARSEWMKQMRKIRSRIQGDHSERCSANYKVEIARAFLNDPMYFPHSLDFRGRAYTIPPHFNHLGNDLCRGLLMFDEAKRLGEEGFNWLKIHLANLAGYDKQPFEERIRFTDDHMDDIIDSAERPLTGNKWWLKAEDPWQCLATCFEIAKAVKSGKPHEYLSRIPVHQDGTCNGLQHYAALGGDLEGAMQVNLFPSETPADIYTGVATRVGQMIKEDAEKGDENANILSGIINRKIVKQTVMTNVYGVTFVGARTQISNRLREIKGLPEDKIDVLAGYIAKKVFLCLGEMFSGARAIQDWLNESAELISKSVPPDVVMKSEHEMRAEEENEEIDFDNEDDPVLAGPKKRSVIKISPTQAKSNQMTAVVWTTPLGLPIVQPYRKLGRKSIKTNLQTIMVQDPTNPSPVDSARQRSAFPPNFIHSLDATHMLMSALECKVNNLTFAAVHDSYWTHACDVSKMNKILREQFIALHREPIMENVRNEFVERYKGYIVPVSMTLEEFEKRNKEAAIRNNIKAIEIIEKEIIEEMEETPTLDAIEDIEGLDLMLAADPIESDLDVEALAVDDETDINLIMDDEYEDAKTTKVGGPRKTNVKKYVHMWEEISFPPLPPKGSFDIECVRKSKYFFH